MIGTGTYESKDAGALKIRRPLRRAKEHARKSFVGWFLAVVAVVLMSVIVPGLFFWPELDYWVNGRVVDIQQVDSETIVTFAADRGDTRITWARRLEDSNWEQGRPIKGWIGTDGRFYSDSDFGWSNPASDMFVLVAGFLLVSAARRTLGLEIAWRDLGRGGDEPRFGYAALIPDYSSRFRPYLAIWWIDPTETSRLQHPDSVYRADDETGEEQASRDPVKVWEAWVDTGRFSWSKPRWVGVKDHVFIPHRRSLFGRSVVSISTRRSRVRGPISMRSGPPSVVDDQTPSERLAAAHKFHPMLLGRLIWVVLIALVAGFLTSGDEVVRSLIP